MLTNDVSVLIFPPSQLFASVTFEVIEESKVRLNYYL